MIRCILHSHSELLKGIKKTPSADLLHDTKSLNRAIGGILHCLRSKLDKMRGRICPFAEIMSQNFLLCLRDNNCHLTVLEHLEVLLKVCQMI